MSLFFWKLNWRPPSLSELTQMIFNVGLTHLGSETSNYLNLPENHHVLQLFKSVFQPSIYR